MATAGDETARPPPKGPCYVVHPEPKAQCFDASETGLGLVGNSPVRTPMRWESAIFPHVLLKNVVVEMQFSREDGLEPVEGYETWTSAFTDGNAVSGPVFAEQEKCEVMMMVGLPASGKSTWAEKWVKDHPEKRFVLLGTNLALDQMKMTRLLGKNNYDESFGRFMARARMIFKTLLDRAVKIPRNYIIDRRNLSKIERIRTLSPFVNHYKSAVVVFPSLRELKNRSAKRFRKTWQAVSSELVDLLAASFVLPLSKDVPGSLEPLDEVIFVENSHEASQRILDNLRHSDGSGTNSTRMSIAYQPDQGPIHPLGVQGCVSTAGSQNQIQSSSNAPHRHLIQETSTKPVDEDFILFRTFDLYEEFESMDFQHGTLTELSKSAETTQDEIDALWDLFRVRIDKCREIRREIRSAGGYPPPIPEWFLA